MEIAMLNCRTAWTKTQNKTAKPQQLPPANAKKLEKSGLPIAAFWELEDTCIVHLLYTYISSRPPPEHPSADQWETSLFLDMKESRALAWPVCSRLQVQLCTSPLVVISQTAPKPLGTYLPRTEHRRTPSSWRELGWSDVERSSNRYHQTIRMLNRIHHGGKQHFRQSKQQRSLVIFCPSFPFHQTIAICKGHLFHLFETGTNLKKNGRFEWQSQNRFRLTRINKNKTGGLGWWFGVGGKAMFFW